MKNKVLKQMLAFSLAVALVGGNSVATFAAEPTNGTESSENTQAATNATTEKKVEKKKTASITFNIDPEMGKFTYPADAEYVAAKGESKLKDLIESAGKINQSVYTDETVNTLNQAKEEAEETIQGKQNQEEVEDSYLNLVNAIQSLQKK